MLPADHRNGQSHGGEPKTPPSDSPRAAARAVALKAAKAPDAEDVLCH